MKMILLTFVSLLSFGLAAQITFNTGDVEFDADLNIINTSAKRDLPAFNADLTATFGVSTKNLDYMVSLRMEPAEMYLALEISVSTGKPIETVIETYEAHKDKGWGYIAQQMGIKPGSDAFHALKGKSKAKKDKDAKSNGNGNGNGRNRNTSTTTRTPR
jgi:hypothetical protein